MQAMLCTPFEFLLAPASNLNSNRKLSSNINSSSRCTPLQANLNITTVPSSFSRKQASLYRILSPCLAFPSGDVPSPADSDPLEVDDFDEEEQGITKFDRIWLESQQARKQEEEYYKKNRSVFREAIGLDPEGEDLDEDDEDRREGPEIIRLSDRELVDENNDFFSAVDAAVASLKIRERASKRSKGLLDKRIPGEDESEEEESGTRKAASARIKSLEDDEGEEREDEGIEEGGELEAGLEDDDEVEEEDEVQEEGEEEEDDILADPSFDLDFTLDEETDQIKEPDFYMTLSELLDEARVVPILVDGDQDIEITGIQYDSQQVSPGNMFVCCPGYSSEGHSSLTEAIEKGAVVIVASMEVSVQETVKAVVVVADTTTILSPLSAAFYGDPSKSMSLVGICGTNGKTTTSYLLKSMYEAMERRTGLLTSIANYIHGKKKLEALSLTLDAVSLHKLMATMVHNGTDTCVMELSSDNNLQNLDYDIAVFMNFTSVGDGHDKLEERHKESMARLFAKMVDPKRHAKVVNMDDDYASYLSAQGSPDVPVVTFSMENREADIYTLEVQLSLFETDVLVHTPRGNVEISSGLLGRHNVYSILAAVAVGIAINAPLEAIVQGIEEVDAVPGRCELIDEEQAFAVIVDHARTPEALSRLLDTVRECGARRLITVVGCEGDYERGKRPVMAKISTEKSEVSILTSDNPRKEDPLYILDDMLAGVGWSMKEYLEHGERDYYPPLRNGHRLFLYDDRAIAVRAAVAMGEEGDAVIIAGKGHETYQLIGEKKEYLDDREECREALQHVDALHAAGIDTSEFPWRLPESH